MSLMPKKAETDAAPRRKETDPNQLSGGSKPKIVPKAEIRSMADKLGKKEKPKKSVFSNPLYIIGAIVAALVLFAIITVVIMMSGNKSTPQTQAIPDAPTAEEIARAESQAALENQNASQVPMATVGVSPDDFSLSPTPIETLSKQVTANALQQTPQYLNGDGMNLRYPDGAALPLNHPYIDKAIADTQTRLQDHIAQNGLIQERTDDTGISAWNIQMPDGTYAPITDPSASNMMRDSMAIQAVSFLTEELNLAPVQAPSVQQQQQPYQGQGQDMQQPMQQPTVVNAMSEQEKQEYRDLINTLRNVNQDLAKQNREVKQEAQTQKEQMVSVLQKIEDNKYASQKLRASSIPLSSGWSLHAIVSDRLWLQDPNGELVSVAEGEAIPTTGLRVLSSESSSGMVLVTPVEK